MIKLQEYQKAGVSLTILPIIPTILLYKHNHILFAKCLILTCMMLGLLCFSNKNVGTSIFITGKKLGKKIGEIFSITALFFVYITAIIPTAIIMQIVKRDRLRLKKQNIDSYWKDIPIEDTSSYENQF